MKTSKILVIAIVCVLALSYACKKTTTTYTEKIIPLKKPVIAEVTSIVLLKMSIKASAVSSSVLSWDAGQVDEKLGPDVMIDLLDSVPYYAVYQGGYLRYDLNEDSLPKTYGQSETFKIYNLTDKYHVLILDWDKNTESEQMGLMPFRLSDYKATKPPYIVLTDSITKSKVALTITWH